MQWLPSAHKPQPHLEISWIATHPIYRLTWSCPLLHLLPVGLMSTRRCSLTDTCCTKQEQTENAFASKFCLDQFQNKLKNKLMKLGKLKREDSSLERLV